MEHLVKFLEAIAASPLFVDALVAVAIAVFGLPRVRQMQDNIRASRAERAYDLLLDALVHTHREYVQARKEASEDGKLTEEEEQMARTRAWLTFRRFAAENAPEVIGAYTRELFDAELEGALVDLKQREVIKSDAEPQGAVAGLKQREATK